MKKWFRRLFKTLLVMLGLVLLLVTAVVVFVNTAPQIGAVPQGEALDKIRQSEHYGEAGFVNDVTTSMDMPVGKIWETLKEFATSKNTVPAAPLPTKFGGLSALIGGQQDALTWYGHSSFLLETNGRKILMDPVFSEHAAPIAISGARFPLDYSLGVKDLPDADIVVISHDHYDHLDYESILELIASDAHFVAPLGVGSHLKHWGLHPDRVTELDWWADTLIGAIELTALPARHFSGRGFERNKTQWASWAIKSPTVNLYFSGDGGYGPHFTEIGNALGPFDMALMECGQYNYKWADIHMMPEQTFKAFQEVNAHRLIPIHWGSFALSVHTWKDPVERLDAAAKAAGVDICTPMLGQRMVVSNPGCAQQWWRELE